MTARRLVADNDLTMRRAWAAQTILTVLLAFIGAPLLHFHLAEQHDGSDGQLTRGHETIVHAHLPEGDVAPDATGGHDAELSHASHDAKPLEVFAVVPNNASVLSLPFLAASRIELAPAPISVERLALQSVTRTHDPPLLDSTGSRAPPA